MRAITPQALKDMQDSGDQFVLINTLPKEKFHKTKIEGAVNIPGSESNFVDQVQKQAGGKKKTIVVYCASTECDSSTNAAKKLEEAGFTDVLDFESGSEGWSKAGLDQTVTA